MICEQKNIKYRKDRLFFKRLRYSTLRFSTWKIWEETNQWFHIDSRLKGRLVGPLKLLLKKWSKRIESSSKELYGYGTIKASESYLLSIKSIAPQSILNWQQRNDS
jgi:hypothetical protein